ncbi:EamA family transporter [Candidatus Methylomirabilis sp.]|uniref:DMT family transporter n=1 Tax=Candidatus Methylomirabilis sp. TaxID=2032687 RepID=UPI002A67D4BC|nr:EamA family transporter [Candidatus Methylomirabilis sp.]
MSNRLIGVLFVLAAVVCEAVGQLCFKHAANHARDSARLSTIRKVFAKSEWIGAGIGCFSVEWGFWTIALTLLPVSVAQPMASVELVVIALLSHSFLKETVNLRRWAGIVLILAGVCLVGFS